MPNVYTAAYHIVFLSLFLLTTYGHGSVPVLDPQIIMRLELFDGANVLQNIDRTKTEIGSACLAYMLANPSAQAAEIYRRQRIIKFLVEHEQVRIQLRLLLNQFSAIERRIVALWRKNTIPASIERLYPPQVIMNLIPQKQLPHMLHIFRICDDWAMAGLVLVALLHARSVTVTGVWNQHAPALDMFYSGAQMVTAGIAVPFTIYEWYRHRTFVRKTTLQVKKRMKPLRTALHLLHKLARYVEKYAELRNFGPFTNIKITNQDDIGTLLAAQKIIQEYGHELTSSLIAVGSLDAYAGLAELVVENPEKKYCYAKCVLTNEPVLEVNNCWSPVVGQTELMKVAIALILAQATGIAPAQSFVFTPFDRICTNSPHNLEPGQRAFVFSTEAVITEEISLWTTERRIWHAG